MIGFDFVLFFLDMDVLVWNYERIVCATCLLADARGRLKKLSHSPRSQRVASDHLQLASWRERKMRRASWLMQWVPSTAIRPDEKQSAATRPPRIDSDPRACVTSKQSNQAGFRAAEKEKKRVQLVRPRRSDALFPHLSETQMIEFVTRRLRLAKPVK